MGRIIRKVNHFIKKEESGQSIVLFVLTLTLLLGAGALAVDLGQSYTQKIRVQKAADLAASSAAGFLAKNDQNARLNAIEAAYQYAEENGMDRSEVTVNTPYEGDPMKIEVICRRTVRYSFARALGFKSGDVDGRAVAQKENYWVGEALPFLNMDGPFWDNSYGNNKKTGAIFQIWDKNNNSDNPLPGNFDRISDKEDGKESWKKKNSIYSKDYYMVDYSDGVTVVNGRRAYIKDHIQQLYDTNTTVYLFSLTKEAIQTQKYNRTNLGNKTNIPLSDLVLLQVEIVSYNQKGSGKYMNVQVKNVYDINNGEFPTTFLRGGVTTTLLE